MVIKKVRQIYRDEKKTSKPIVIEFRKKDGSVVKFRGIRIIKKPQKIVFRKIKKVYYRPVKSRVQDKEGKNE